MPKSFKSVMQVKKDDKLQEFYVSLQRTLLVIHDLHTLNNFGYVIIATLESK